MSKLFSSIELILNVNEELLASLENLLNGKEYVYGLGDVFLEFVCFSFISISCILYFCFLILSFITK